MFTWIPDLPAKGWRKVLESTGLTTLIVAALAVLGTVSANLLEGRPTIAVDYYSAIGLAVVLTIPLYGFLAIKLQQMHVLNIKLHELATTDFLTGALNRGAFVTEVEKLLFGGAVRSTALTSVLLVIDVDHFKSINDRFGHQAGDLALVRIADSLRQTMRETDLLGRLGGEEFGIFMPNVAPDAAIRAAETCRIAVEQCPFSPMGEEQSMSVSIGVVFARQHDDFTSLFKQADTCLYLAKNRGRNRVEVETSPLAA